MRGRVLAALLAALVVGGVLGAAPASAAGTGSIVGTATQAGGGPVAGVAVIAYSPTYGAVMASTSTDATGAYALTGLDATGFKVQFVPPAGAGPSQWYDGQDDFAGATVIDVPDGATVVANLVLPPVANQPLFLDGTGSTFGNQLGPPITQCTDPQQSAPLPNAAACAGVTVPNYWGTINGPYETHANGDPYVTRCWGDSKTASSCTSPASGMNVVANPTPPSGHADLNGTYHPDGYLYALDVQSAGTVTFEIYDAAYDARSSNTKETGDNCSTCGTDQKDGPTTEFTLYDASPSLATLDATPGHTMLGRGACSGTDLSGAAATGTLVASPHGKDAANGGTQTPSLYKNRWTNLCTFDAPGPGVYALRVRVDDIPGLCTFTNVWTPDGCIGAGQNSFAFHATGTATTEIHAVDAAAMYSDFGGFTTTFKVAVVGAQYAGQTLVFDLFDPGDVTGTAIIQLQPPPDASGAAVPAFNCDWARSVLQGGTPTASATDVSGCSIVTATGGTNQFNNQWVRIRIPLPATYSCAANCRWRVSYAGLSGTSFHDHITWQAHVVADLTGTVTNTFGVAFAHVPVAAVDAANVTRATTTTDVNGAYSFQLPAGTYKVRVGSYFATAVQWYPGQATANTATALAVAPGTTTFADETLHPGGSLSGTVTDGSVPLPGIVAIAVTDSATPGFATNAVTDANGHYTISHLLPGSYKVLFLDPAWLADPATGHLPAFNGSVTLSEISIPGLLAAYGAATPAAVAASATTSGIDTVLPPA